MGMDKPRCRVCGARHWSNEAHEFKSSDDEVGDADEVHTGSEDAVGGITSLAQRKASKAWREANPEAYRTYMQQYMKDYRAGIRRRDDS